MIDRPVLIAYVRGLVHMLGLPTAAQRMRVSREALARLCAGFPISRGTLLVIEQFAKADPVFKTRRSAGEQHDPTAATAATRALARSAKAPPAVRRKTTATARRNRMGRRP